MVWEFVMDGQDFIRWCFQGFQALAYHGSSFNSCSELFPILLMLQILKVLLQLLLTPHFLHALRHPPLHERWEMIDHLVHNLSWFANFNTWQTSEFQNSIISLPLPYKDLPTQTQFHTQTTVILCYLIDEATQQMDIPTSVKFRSDKRTIYKCSMQVAPAMCMNAKLLSYCSLGSLGKKMVSISFWHQDADREVRDVLSRSFRGPATGAGVLR